jgi:hypothetical protein
MRLWGINEALGHVSAAGSDEKYVQIQRDGCKKPRQALTGEGSNTPPAL